MIVIYRYVKHIFPKVKKTLKKWEQKARSIPDPALKEQALESIHNKEFHCLGGSIYALYPGADTDSVIDFIVAYQTISDYLDNLVDNANVCDERAFTQLHLAMTESLDPEAELSDYYAYYPYKNDGGYLNSLVNRCQELARNLHSYFLVKDHMIKLARYYSLLQTTKHLEESIREEKMLSWIREAKQEYPDISEWEFAAATGSTLGIFFLHVLSSNPNLDSKLVERVVEVYFPWIEGLHILLDYFIDLQEDRQTQQLNFVEYYKSVELTEKRLKLFVKNSLELTKELPHSSFHQRIVKGLLAMYLSDPKGEQRELVHITQSLINEGGPYVKVLYLICNKLRKSGIL